MQLLDSQSSKNYKSVLLHAHKNIIEYNSNNKQLWNKFISKAKNANFQHRREYMEYHAERFTDNSLLFMKDNNVQCLMPANIKDNILYSHEGITFGGLLFSSSLKQRELLNFFDNLMNYAQKKLISTIVLKPQPHIYNSYFSEELLYALFKNHAFISGRAVSSVINLENKLPYGKGRKWSLKKSLNYEISISESKNYDCFMEIEKELLKRKYGAIPVHTAQELRYLSLLYPDKIKLFTINYNNEMIGGVVLFFMNAVVKCQYICSNDICKEMHALDFLFTELINRFIGKFKYFDFGHSTLKEGYYLEDTLIQNKESYGARGVCYDTYSINI